ncbi:hypothetical protein EBR21_01620 [bacterium]|nr:hypothetical protein [bacterium]
MQKGDEEQEMADKKAVEQASEAGELWSRYNQRQNVSTGLSKLGLGIVIALALAVLFVGLWIVSFR